MRSLTAVKNGQGRGRVIKDRAVLIALRIISARLSLCTNTHMALLKSTGPNFIELLEQNKLLDNFQLSRNEQDTSHKLYM